MTPDSSVPGRPIQSKMELAGFGRRYLALLLDILILELLGGCVTAPMLALGDLDPASLILGSPEVTRFRLGWFLVGYIGLLAGLMTWYFTWFNSQVGQTPGKWLLGLKLVHRNGKALSPTTALMRLWFGILVALITLGFSYTWAGFDKWRQALHDKICDSIVVTQSKA